MAPDTDARTRRGALTSIATVLAGLSLGGTTVARETASAQERQDEQPPDFESSASTAAGTHGSAERYEWYSATVDRIVDDRHVVVLLEGDGRVVEQVVVDRSELPTVEARDELLVLMDGDELAAAIRL